MTPGTSPPPGRIDIHSHLLPGIDDGCRIIDESIDCVQRLQQRGYVGTICTPHIWQDQFPENTAENIRAWTAQLQEDLKQAGLDYRVWPGGEMRLFDGVSKWMEDHEPPTLAGSKCLLFDFWAEKWPKWVAPEFEKIAAMGFQPILAHPERLRCGRGLDGNLAELAKQGIWLQGNFNSMTGQEGFNAAEMIRQLLAQNRYRFLAMDMHGPETLDGRLNGMALAEAEFGVETVQRLTDDAVRTLILHAAAL